ncbi:NLR family CARD domain-containing protein 3-like isoform X2 [Sardina pilchardus]|uniref:NLR family CARD domain-containing protein 3-like isoform X2 n=1 Tax=Sardina pilchardus TaxID=27697 RepID=UPI002E12FEB3
MDFPQEGEDAVGGNQTGRGACAVSSHVSMKNEEPVTDGHQGVSTGRVLSYPRPQTHRPVSPVPSCVSMKSEGSMHQPHNFSSGLQSNPKPQSHRPVSPVPSCVSMKSDQSMPEPYNFSSRPPLSDSKPQTHRPVSPVPSCVSMKSDQSMPEPYNFSSRPPLSDSKPQTHRPVSPVPSCVSMKSDQSMPEPYNFSSRPPLSDSKPQTHRPASPVPSCVSMKSDQSMPEPYNFSSGPPLSDSKNILTQDQSRCGVCEQLLRDPVITSCGHSFCRQCISSYWSQSGPSGDYSCPQCRKRPRTQPIMNPDMTQPLYPSTDMAQPHLYPPTAKAQPQLYPSTAMAQPHLYPPTAMEQPPSYQHSEMALHLNPSANMAQVPPSPHTDTGQHSQYSNSAMGQHNHPHIQYPLYPHIHTAQISPQPPLDEHTVMTGSTHLQTEHVPVKRAKRTDDDVLTRVLMTHKAIMKRRFESICEGIIRSGTQTLLNKIYTELYITEGESEGVNNEHEVWQVESASRPQTTEDTAINCNDIFKPLPGQERHIRTVMTKGIAGIGKTVSVQKFILDWAEERANQDVDFMFVLPFRELNLVKHDQYSLHRLLLDFHPELRELQDGEYKDCCIVFIFDGLDESRLPLNFPGNQTLSDVTQTSSVDVLMTSLIQGTLLSSALIWITSRPAATSQIPSQCISQVTEVRGFNDPQKEEYFRKRISDQNQANRIVSHIKESRSLHIMCHMPVFCWISATVLQQILEQDDGKEAPKTLTEMFIHFLLIQTTRKNQKYQEESETNRQRLLESHKGVILKLAELAFKHLENGNLMFYEEDLSECGINASEASVYSGMCTEIFREECVFHHKKVYCFVHLSIQEFLAALHLFASYLSKNMEVLKPFLSRKSRSLPDVPLDDLLKNAVNKALESRNGHLDLFVRFLHGISLVSNQRLLLGLLIHTHSSPESVKKTIKNLKVMQRQNISPERCINLFHCLVEMHDSSVHDEIQAFLKAEKGAVKQLTLAHCSALAHVLLMSDEVLDEFDLRKYKTSPEGRRRLVPAVRCCRKAVLADCKLTEKSCEIVASALQSANSPLRELDLSQNDLQNSGDKLFSAVQSPNCKLETLRLVGCKLKGQLLALTLQWANSHLRELDISDSELQDCEGELPHQPLNQDCKVRLISRGLKDSSCVVVVSVLGSCISQLSELDMSGCDLQTSDEKKLSGLRNPNCRLEKLRLVGCKLRGRFLALTLQWANSHLRELDISDSELQDCGGELLHQPLNQDCKVRLISRRLKDSSSEVVVSVLQSYISQLSELDMSGCDLQTSEEKLLSGLRDPNCHLEKLRLAGCKLRGRFLALTLQWANSHLRELDISDSELQDCGGELLHQPLNQDCKVRLISCRLKCSSCEVVVSVLQSYNSQLSEVDMSGCDLQTSEEKLLSGLRNPNCHLDKLRLAGCKLTEESCKAVASALQSSISLKELDLSHNDLKESGVQLLSTGLSSPHCILTSLRLAGCVLTEESCKAVASALQSSISLKELDLSHNDLKESGVQHLSTGLSSPHCKLQTLRLNLCHLSKASCEMMASVLQSAPSHLRELDMSDNDLQDEGVELFCAGLRDPQCKLDTLRLSGCLITHEGCSLLSSALKSNPSYLKQLDLSYNHPGDSGVRELTDRLNDPICKLETLRYDYGGEYRIKPGLRKYACELTLDPNTAYRYLSLSEGNRKVTYGQQQQPYPDHPERFDSQWQVLCREGLSGHHPERCDSLGQSLVSTGQSGRYYWEAEWSGLGADIAVAYKSMERKGSGDSSRFGHNDKSWSLQCSSNRYSARHNNKETAIPAPCSNNVGVYLDWPAGTLSFYSISSNTLTHLHTFHSTFTEPLYPGFFLVFKCSMSLCQIT